MGGCFAWAVMGVGGAQNVPWVLRPGGWGGLAGGTSHSPVLPSGVGDACAYKGCWVLLLISDSCVMTEPIVGSAFTVPIVLLFYAKSKLNKPAGTDE